MDAQERRILVAAEDESRLAPLVEILRQTPHAIAVADSEGACRKLERGQGFDLLIAEVEPPQMAGFTVVKTFHRMLGPDRPVLVVSEAFKREHIEGMLENLGVRRLFPLHVRPEEMMFWVNNALFPEAMRSRKAPRIPASFTMSVAEQRRVLRGRAFTLSEDGLFLETTLVAEPGQVLELRFRLPGHLNRREGIVARCEVVWANTRPRAKGSAGQPPYGLGLRFVEFDEVSRAAIKSYVLQNLLEDTI